MVEHRSVTQPTFCQPRRRGLIAQPELGQGRQAKLNQELIVFRRGLVDFVRDRDEIGMSFNQINLCVCFEPIPWRAFTKVLYNRSLVIRRKIVPSTPDKPIDFDACAC